MLKRMQWALLGLALVLAVAGIVLPAAEPEVVALGTTNLNALELSDTLTVDGASTLTGAQTLTGATTMSGNATVGGTLGVTGAGTFAAGSFSGIVTGPAVGVENVRLPSVVSTNITYTAAAGGTGAVATIADGEVWFVHDVFVNVTTDFDCTGDDALLTIGDGNDANGFIDLADAELQAADTEATGFAAGWQGLIAATQGVYIDEAAGANTFIYAPSGAAETIDWLLDETSGETITAGAATIYVVYTRIS
jgi:hypothetical protein